MADLNTLHLPAPTGGIQHDAAPRAIPPNRAASLVNFLCDKPGKLRLRGPLGTAKTIFSSSTTPTGIWTFGEKFLVSNYATSKLYDTDADTVDDVTLPSTSYRMVGRSARLGSYAYAPSTAGPALLWDGTTSPPVTLPHSPVAAADVVSHLSRIFMGGIGSSPTNPLLLTTNIVGWSDVGGVDTTTQSVTAVAATDIFTCTAHGFIEDQQVQFTSKTGGTGLSLDTPYYVISVTTNTFQVSTLPAGMGSALNITTDMSAGTVWSDYSSWRDDTSGLQNRLVVGDDADEIVALASIRNQLIVFKRFSVWSITGDRPSQFLVRQIAGTMGCLDKMSVTVVDDNVFFVDNSGLPRMFDGVTFTQLDGINGIVASPSTAWSMRLPNDHIMWMLNNGSAWSTLLFYIPTGAWSEFTYDTTVLDTTVVPLAAVTEFGVPFLFDDEVARSAADVPFGIVTNGIEGSTLPRGTVIYRTEQLSLPMFAARLQQIEVDEILDSGTAGDCYWAVSVDSQGIPLTTYNVLSSTADTMVYDQKEIVDEVQDVTIRIDLDPDTVLLGPPTTVTKAELYDVWIQYGPVYRMAS